MIIVSLADEHSWAPSEQPHRTSPSKLHPQQHAGQRPRRGEAGRVRRNITPDNSRCQSASANSIERDHQRFPQITGSSNRRTPVQQDEPADNRRAQSQSRQQKGRQSLSTSLPQSRECVVKAIVLRGLDAMLGCKAQTERAAKASPPDNGFVEQENPRPTG